MLVYCYVMGVFVGMICGCVVWVKIKCLSCFVGNNY